MQIGTADKESAVSKFIIQPHMRLQEWVAEAKGYFADENLDYEFINELVSKDGKLHDLGDKVGAFQTIERGRHSDISCACHWTVTVAASKGHGKLYEDMYSIAPCGVFVPPESPVKTAEDLAGVPISVGYQSGSHYATVQALEQYFDTSNIKLSFAEGMPFKRMELLYDRKILAATVFSGSYYFMEQMGFRKVVDATFMITTLITGDPDPSDVHKYFRALRRAQHDIDLRPERYTQYYKKEFPPRFIELMDTRRWGPGERLVFEPYSKDTFNESFSWIAAHEIFQRSNMGPGNYEKAIASLAAS